MTYDEIIAKVSAEENLPRVLVDKAYKAYWKAVREHVSSLPLKEDLADEEFLALRPNVNIPSIGKLYVTLERYRGMKKRFRILNELKNRKNAAHKQDNT